MRICPTISFEEIYDDLWVFLNMFRNKILFHITIYALLWVFIRDINNIETSIEYDQGGLQ